MKKILLGLLTIIIVTVVTQAKSMQCTQTMALQANSNKVVFGKSHFPTTVSYDTDRIIVKDINGKVFMQANFLHQGMSKGGRNAIIYKSSNKKVLITVSEGDTDRFIIIRALNTNGSRQVLINCH